MDRPLQLTLADASGIDQAKLMAVLLAGGYRVERGLGAHINGVPIGTWIITETPTK